MGGLSIWHWTILLAIIVLLFGGKGKISGIMSDFGTGMRSLRDGLRDDGPPTPTRPQPEIAAPVSSTSERHSP